jgi:hypothetical protein
LVQGVGFLQNMCGHPAAHRDLQSIVSGLLGLLGTHGENVALVRGSLECLRNLCATLGEQEGEEGPGAMAASASAAILAAVVPTVVDALHDHGEADADSAEAAMVGALDGVLCVPPSLTHFWC